ncbi:GLPGLI family protein [Sphingobacterium sp. SGG-5]|uniref:GLPGLI family protein n=1 Tax=Sphingobacterium sp. SGG-5 TaxID=2710881 RepID=UPI0013EA7596|nr:GLPGLI family protein [Sphingobacterium sp. SGG-5]NGM61204.1 GLPGLI family protein [Sphingobacterium sp. SGG-5]
MNSLYTLCVALVLSTQVSYGQFALFGKSGVVQYDKTMYMKNIVSKQFIAKADGNTKTYFERMLSTVPENVVLKKELKFNGSRTLFAPVEQDLDEKTKRLIMMFALDMEAVTLSDLKTRDYKRFNDLMGEKVVIQDTVKRMKWKITDEYREIAGYNCRRANGLTPDSVYVIGYFANEIPLDGGPESINGLPGMILGLVVPSQHVSYFATKVEFRDDVSLEAKVFNGKKNKVMSREELEAMFSQSLSNFLNNETAAYIMKLTLL